PTAYSTTWSPRASSVQLAHRPEGGVADIEPRLDEVAQLEQADAELVDAGVAAIDEARGDQVVEYAVGRGRMQSGTSGELLQADRVGLGGQGVEERHHAIDHLDRGLALLSGVR